jgi:hypothetical protein
MNAKRVLLGFAVLVVLAQVYVIFEGFTKDTDFLEHYPTKNNSEAKFLSKK